MNNQTKQALEMAIEEFETCLLYRSKGAEYAPKQNVIQACKDALEQPSQDGICKYGNKVEICTNSPMDCQCSLDATFEQPAQVVSSKMETTISMLGYELDGVIEDVKRDGFDKVCLDTIKRVRKALGEYQAQEPVAFDGKFPENFDSSLGIPAQYLRLANGIMMDYMGKRSWGVPMCATAIMEFINTHPAPSWQGLSDDEITQLKEQAYVGNEGGGMKFFDYNRFARAIEQALKEKNHG